jgi:hypothetical protein
MPNTNKAQTSAPAQGDEDFGEDLFAGGDTDTPDGAFDEADDLLDSVQEDDSEGWVPTEKGESLSGIVVKIGETRSDFAKPGEDAMVPTVTVKTRDGSKYRVIGYGSVLKREIEDNDPQVGDVFAVKYWGEKPIRKGPYAGKNYKHYTVAVRKASAAAR